MKADLHNHSRYSDGYNQMKTVMEMGVYSGLDYIAVTDHDTFTGADKAKSLSMELGINTIYGTEMSCFDYDRGNKVHLLCYEPIKKGELSKYCEDTIKNRTDAAMEVLTKIRKRFYFDDDRLEEVKSLTGCIYKQNILQVLMECGYTDKIYGELYKELFSKNSECYYKIDYPSVFEIAKVIKQSGGLCVMAHPGNYRGIEIMKELAAGGYIDGIELIHPSNGNVLDEVKNTIEKNGLFATGGTDFHGMYNSKIMQVGDYTISGRDLDIFLKRIKEKKNAFRL